jgi:hypothetical protein
MSAMPFIPPIVLALLLFVVTVLIHYEGLRLISLGVDVVRLPPRPRMLIVIFGVLCIHLVEIGIFAFSLYAMDGMPYEGGIRGHEALDGVGYFYISAQIFSTLGFGDYVPFGDLRIVAAIEPIIGLLMIGWSVSFTFLAMQRLWKLHAIDS